MEAFEDPAFDPHNQTIILTYPDGSTTAISAGEITREMQYGIRMTAIFASQIGACGTLCILLYVLSRTERRAILLRLVNLLALILVVARSTLQIVYWTGPYYDFYSYFAYDNTDIPDSARAKSMAAAILAGLLQATVLASLVLQIRTLFNTEGWQKEGTTAFAVGIASMSLGFFFAAIYENTQAIMDDMSYLRDWKYDVGQIIYTVCICVFSFIMFWKLLVSIRKRSRLKMRQFGPLQILCIGAFQTMFIPGICAIIESTGKLEGIGSLTSTVTAMSLPLSTIWAALDAKAKEAAAANKWGILPSDFGSSFRSSKGSNMSSSVFPEEHEPRLSSENPGRQRSDSFTSMLSKSSNDSRKSESEKQ